MSNKYIVGCFQIYYFFQLSTSKGLIAGNLRYMEEDGTRVQCTCSATATAVPTNIQGMQHLITDAKFLLIVEKDATFQRLLDDNFCSRMSPCIMVTGKGVPDLNTRLLVKKLWDTFHIPVFTLVDADPYGNPSWTSGTIVMTVPCHECAFLPLEHLHSTLCGPGEAQWSHTCLACMTS